MMRGGAKQTTVIRRGPGNAYLETNIVPNVGTYPNPTPAIYDQSFSEAIVNDPSEHYCAITSFAIPLDLVPICRFDVKVDQNNPNIGTLVFGIKYSGVLYPQEVVYVPDNNLPAPIPGSGPIYFNNSQATDPYYNIFSISQYLSMFNKAINVAMLNAGLPMTFTIPVAAANATVFDLYQDVRGNQYFVTITIVGGTTLTVNQYSGGIANIPSSGTLTKISGSGDATITITGAATPSGVARPYYAFLVGEQVFTLTVGQDFIDTGAQIFLNQDAEVFLGEFRFFEDSTLTTDGYLFYHILDTSTFTPASSYTFIEDGNSLCLWYDTRRISIVSDLPVSGTYIPVQNPNGQITSVTSFVPVLQDFIIPIENSLQNTLVVYFPQGQYHLIDMVGNSPVQRLQLRMYWIDTQGNQNLIYINPKQSITFTIGFFKRYLYDGSRLEYNM